jgi:hypothetical protein
LIFEHPTSTPENLPNLNNTKDEQPISSTSQTPAPKAAHPRYTPDHSKAKKPMQTKVCSEKEHLPVDGKELRSLSYPPCAFSEKTYEYGDRLDV